MAVEARGDCAYTENVALLQRPEGRFPLEQGAAQVLPELTAPAPDSEKRTGPARSPQQTAEALPGFPLRDFLRLGRHAFRRLRTCGATE